MLLLVKFPPMKYQKPSGETILRFEEGGLFLGDSWKPIREGFSSLEELTAFLEERRIIVLEIVP